MVLAQEVGFSMYNFTNISTIYTDINSMNFKVYMKRICKKCNQSKDESCFYTYRKYNKCIECLNMLRRNKYAKSICRHCKDEFRPGIKGRYKFCSLKCRFMNKVTIDNITGCWNWKASATRTGYGTFVPIGKKSGLAHRESYRLFKGEISENMGILHSCHRPVCVAPDHLREGTPMDNHLDKIEEGTLGAKLSPEDVLKIRKMASDNISRRIIAEKFDISIKHLESIIHRRTWKHV